MHMHMEMNALQMFICKGLYLIESYRYRFISIISHVGKRVILALCVGFTPFGQFFFLLELRTSIQSRAQLSMLTPNQQFTSL